MAANTPARRTGSARTRMTYQASDELIDQIWQDLHRLIPRRRVAQVARQVAAGFADAKVAAYVPLFVRRDTCKWLLHEATAAATDQEGVNG